MNNNIGNTTALSSIFSVSRQHGPAICGQQFPGWPRNVCAYILFDVLLFDFFSLYFSLFGEGPASGTGDKLQTHSPSKQILGVRQVHPGIIAAPSGPEVRSCGTMVYQPALSSLPPIPMICRLQGLGPQGITRLCLLQGWDLTVTTIPCTLVPTSFPAVPRPSSTHQQHASAIRLRHQPLKLPVPTACKPGVQVLGISSIQTSSSTNSCLLRSMPPTNISSSSSNSWYLLPRPLQRPQSLRPHTPSKSRWPSVSARVAPKPRGTALATCLR
jgi:hypothetical protein